MKITESALIVVVFLYAPWHRLYTSYILRQVRYQKNNFFDDIINVLMVISFIMQVVIAGTIYSLVAAP